MNLDDIRKWFPHTEHTNYLNHAATSPLSTRVTDALHQFIQERQGSNVDNYWDFAPVIEETRSRLARLIKCRPANVDFVANTSYGLNLLARGLEWKEGDRITIPACEFPANVFPFLPLRDRGVTIDFVPHDNGTFTLEDIERNLFPSTRMLTVSWVQFLSGFRADIAAIGALCRDRGIIFCVDAIQGMGSMVWPDEPDTLGVDFMAGSAHKWLMGTQGVGYVYVSDKLLNEITSPMAGWLSGPVDWDNFFDYRLEFHPDATRYRIGTMNNLGIAAFHASLGQYLEANPDQSQSRILSLGAHLRQRLLDLRLHIYGTDALHGLSGITTLQHPRAEEIVLHLKKCNIEVAYRNRMIRFSPTWYNTVDEIESAIQEIESFLDGRG
jgi:selenocysteine lyase/cysteine desulfurase